MCNMSAISVSCAPKLARKCDIEHWLPCGADGQAGGLRAVYGHVITKFSGMGRFTYPWCSAGALRAPELRYYYHFSHFKNHPTERKWVEFSSRVNYPVKRALNAMVNEDLINVDDDMNKFCVSCFTFRVADIGIKQVISSWNNHAIPGKSLLRWWWFSKPSLWKIDINPKFLTVPGV